MTDGSEAGHRGGFDSSNPSSPRRTAGRLAARSYSKAPPQAEIAARLEVLLDIETAGRDEVPRDPDPSARDTAIAAGLEAALFDPDGVDGGQAAAAAAEPGANDIVPARPNAPPEPLASAAPAGDAEPTGEARAAAIAAALGAELLGAPPETERPREPSLERTDRGPRRAARPIAARIAAARIAPVVSGAAAAAAISARASIGSARASIARIKGELPRVGEVAGRLPKIGRRLPRLSGIRSGLSARRWKPRLRFAGDEATIEARQPTQVETPVDIGAGVGCVTGSPTGGTTSGAAIPATDAVSAAGPVIDDFAAAAVPVPVDTAAKDRAAKRRAAKGSAAARPAIAADAAPTPTRRVVARLAAPDSAALAAVAATFAAAAPRRRAVGRPVAPAAARGLRLTAAPGARPAASRYWLVAASLGAGMLIATGVVAMALNGSGADYGIDSSTSAAVPGENPTGDSGGGAEAGAVEIATGSEAAGDAPASAPAAAAAAEATARSAVPVLEAATGRTAAGSAEPASARRISLASNAPRSDPAVAARQETSPPAAPAATTHEPDGGDGFAVVSSRFADWQRPAGEGQRQAALGTISGGRLGMVAPGVMAGGVPTASAETEAIDPAGAVPTPASMVRPYFPETPPLPAPRAETPKAAEPAAKSNGKIVRSVNMRSRPATGSSTITVIPGGSSVGVVSCRHWCQVEYDGRRGYVYKSFLQR